VGATSIRCKVRTACSLGSGAAATTVRPAIGGKLKVFSGKSVILQLFDTIALVLLPLNTICAEQFNHSSQGHGRFTVAQITIYGTVPFALLHIVQLYVLAYVLVETAP
jgi:hypothetical protein